MAVDQITPSRAAAFTNNLPEVIGVPANIVADIRLPSNLASFTQVVGTQDGVNMFVAGGANAARLLLLTQQSNQAENGLYFAGVNLGVSVTVSGTFDGSGNYQKTGLTANRLYYVTLQVSGQSVTNGVDTLVYPFSGVIAASGTGTLTFGGGTTGQTNTNTLNEAQLFRHPSYDQPNEFPTSMRVRVLYGTKANTWWNLRQTVPTIGTSPVIFDQILPSSHTDFGVLDDPFTNADA